MTDDKQKIKEITQTINRIFEQPSDSISFYCDLTQVFGTTNEIMLQLYETIPGPPGQGGKIAQVRTRLRATIALSKAHAENIGKLLVEKTKEPNK